MAQIVKLRRTATAGKVPTISNLELGELAMNTNDGRIFFEKNDGTATVQEILTTNPNTPTTGSLNINGAVTASYFVGDGSGLTGLSSAANGQLTVQGTGALGGTGTFTANQSTNTTISITHDTLTPSTTTDTATATHGGTIDVIDGVTFDDYGHVSTINTKTITLPSDNNTTYGAGTGLDLNGTTFSFDGNGTGVVSGSVLRTLNGTGVISGSVLRPNGDGIISQSQQVDYNNIQNQPSIPTVGDGSITIVAGTALSNGGSFTTNQSADGEITINHSSITRSDTTSTESPSFGSTFTAVDSITTSTEGHITAVNVATITIPQQSATDDVSVANLESRLAQIDSDINIGDATGRTFTVRDNLVVTGDLTVSGNTTTTTSEILNIEDNQITLNSNVTGTPNEDAGIEVNRGTEQNAGLIWDETDDTWKAGLSGSEYQILTTNNNTDNLSEGSSNLYYTSTRFDSSLSSKTLDDITEGSTNLFYNDNRVKSKLNSEGVISGSVLRPNGDGIISQSQQVSYNGITDKPNIFKTIAVSGQDDVVSDGEEDTLTFVAGTNVSITTDATADSIRISSNDTTYSNGTGISINGSNVISFTGNGTNVVSGSVLRPGGDNVISESVQISNLGFLSSNGDGIVSESAQVVSLYNSGVSQVSSAEITAGTGNTIRRYSPADIVDFITTHEGHTTYDLSVQAGGANTSVIRLAGSDSTNDDVTLSGGTGITITESGNTITITGNSSYGNSDVLTYINGLNVFSSSNQVDYNSVLNTPTIPSEIFKTIAVSGQDSIVADSSTDTLTLAAGSNVTITTNNTTDTITITSANDNTTYGAGTGLDLTGTTFSFDGKGTGVVSGSVLRPNGDNVISESQQVDYNNIQNQPSIPSVGNGVVTIQGTNGLAGTAEISMNQSADETVSITHATLTPTANTSTASPSHGGTFTVIDSVTFDSYGHPTAYNTKTVTLPTDNNTTYSAGTGLDLTGTTFSFDGKGTGVISGSVLRPNGDNVFTSSEQVDYSNIQNKPTIPTAVFKTIAVDGQDNIVADSATDTLSIIAGSNVTITTDASTDGITITSANDNTTYGAGTGLDLNGTTFSFDGNGTGVISGSATEVRSFLNVENGATADQSDSEIETAYNNQVSQVSSAERTNGTETGIRRFAPADIKSMIDTHETNTTYVTATDSTLGLVKIGYTENGKNYPVELSSGKMFVNVPWTDSDTVYVHPDISATNTTSTASPSHGGTFTAVDSMTVNENGHVTEFNTKTVTLPSDNNTDVDVSVANLRTRLGQISDDTTIGDGTDVDITFSGGVTITGNLNVQGTETVISTSNLAIEDKLISIGRGTLTPAAADDSGIHISGSDVRFTWNNTGGYMNLNKDLNVDSTISTSTIHLGSTNTSSFLTGDSKLSIDGYMMVKGLVNTGETGTGPAAITFGNGSTLGTDEISLIAGGNTQIYLNTSKIDLNDVVNVNDTTQSTSKTTGALIVDGGVGIAKTLNVGEDVIAYASSDERYKDNVTPIENPNEKLKQIGGYTFDWNDKHEVFKGQHDVGVIAQEIEKVLPEIVETRESGYKAVKYEKIVALLIESNKELLKRIEDLESKIK